MANERRPRTRRWAETATEANLKRVRRTLTGPGAADLQTAPTGIDTPESGSKGMAQTRERGVRDQAADTSRRRK